MNISNKINDISVHSVSILSFGLFYIWMSIKATFIFIQFSTFEILSVAVVFLGLFVSLSKIFLNSIFKEKVYFSIENIIVSVLIVLLLVLFSDIIIVHWMKPGYYYPFFPLLDVELAINWNRDSAFHSTNVQSILNFAYPSIGLHDTPVMIYHTLSHYIDAFIILITGVEVFDSYGLFFYFKTVMFISSVLIFITCIHKKNNMLFFIVSLIISLALIIGSNGIAIGSHGLWFTSILVIISFYKIFTIVIKEEFTYKNFSIICLFLIIIGLGKISTGFMYAVFIGFILLFRFPKNKYVYLTGSIWIVFFYYFQRLMIVNHTELNISMDIIKKTYQYMLSPSDVLVSIYISMLVIFIQIILLSKEKKFDILIPMVISLVIMSIVIKLNPNMSATDIYYFEHGYSSILILVILYNFFKVDRTKYIIIVLILILFGKLLTIPDKILNNPSKHYLDIKYKNKLDNNRELYSFREELKKYMKKNKLTKKNTLLYLPKEIYRNELSKFKGRGRRGFLVYSITGVPLIYGVSSLANDYGHADYDKSSLWLSIKDFTKQKACQVNSDKNIVIVNSVLEKNFSMIKCKEINNERR